MNYPALKALSPPPIATVRYWPCNESGRYVFAKNIDTTKSYYVTIRHFAKNLNEPNSPDFTGDTSYTMEPESRFGLGCTISLGYDGQPSYLHKWEVIE